MKDKRKRRSAIAALIYLMLVVVLLYIGIIQPQRWWAIPMFLILVLVSGGILGVGLLLFNSGKSTRN